MSLYSINCYYGIHYNTKDNDHIYNGCYNAGYNQLCKKGEQKITNNYFCIMSNSFGDNAESRGAVYIDNFTIEGKEYENIQDCYLHIEPSYQIHIEESYPELVDKITDIYESIIVEYNKNKENVPSSRIYLGWSNIITVCDKDI